MRDTDFCDDQVGKADFKMRSSMSHEITSCRSQNMFVMSRAAL